MKRKTNTLASILLAGSMVFLPVCCHAEAVESGPAHEIEKTTTTTDEHQQTTTAVMVIFVGFEVFGQNIDTLGKKRNLDFG